MKHVKSGGGWPAIRYTLQKVRETGGGLRLWRAMRSKNTCKTCALGMGGQQGGMVNEAGHFPEVCKKSLQAMASDLQPAIDPVFFEQNSVSKLQHLSPRELESLGRLAHPIVLEPGADHFKTISWEDAYRKTVTGLKAVSPDESFFYFSGRSSNEAGFLLQLFARMFGTNNVNNCSYYCHQASGVGMSSAIGSGTATIVLDDLEKSDVVFVIGANPASNHPRLIRTLMDVRRRGGQVVVVNPIREKGLINFRVPSSVRSMIFGSEIASTYVQPHIGGDLAFLTGVAKYVLEHGMEDRSFISDHTNGFDQLRKQLDDISLDDLETESGVRRETMLEVAKLYGNASNVIFSWAMGVTHHARGTETVQAIVNLALMRGMIGKQGAGLMPIRGHSNVQGIGSVGVTPKLKDAIFEKLESVYGLKLPDQQGLDTMACMEAAERGDLRFGLCLGGNLYGSNPDSHFAAKALAELDQLVYLSTTLNTGHVWGCARETLVLPVLARDEDPQSTTQESMFNFVRLSDGGPSRFDGPLSELDVISSIASRVLGDSGPINWTKWKSVSTIRQAISDVVPGYGAIQSIDKSGDEFQIEGRTFHSRSFSTEDGRAVFHSHRIDAPAPHPPNSLRLMTIRSEGQFNTVVYEEEDLYRGIDRRDVILLHPADAKRFHFSDKSLVRITGPAGIINSIRVVYFEEIREGNAAMYFPEANVLLSRNVDPLSRTPAFKGARITISTMLKSVA